MDLVRVRSKESIAVPAREAPPVRSADSVWQSKRFWFYVRIGVFLTVFLAVFLLFPRNAR